MDGLKEIAVVWRSETLRAVRSARMLVLLGLYSMFSLVVMLVFPPDVAFKFTLFFIPVYVILMGFDQISGEVGPRSIRYLTVRARVSSVLLGKFLVQTSLLMTVVLLIDVGLYAALSLYTYLRHPDFVLPATTMNPLKLWGCTMVFSLAYMALTSLCSSLFRASGLSLVFNFVMVFSFLLLELAGWYFEGKSFLTNVRYLAPSHYSANLLSPVLSDFGLSALAYVCFTVVFLGASYGVLRARDL